MALTKTRGGSWQVIVYVPAGLEHPQAGRKWYVGTRLKHGDAKTLERDTISALKRQAAGKKPFTADQTVRDYADDWLDLHHGEGSRRPSPKTLQLNEQNLRAFLEEFGDRPMRGDGAIRRGEALRWCKLDSNAYRAKAVSAMFQDAIDDEVATVNPFANRRAKQSSERKHISPLTEQEVDRLADIALRHWGRDGYGLVARAWVLFGAWVGARPGETFATTRSDLEVDAGLVWIQRVKPPYKRDHVVLPVVVVRAIAAMPRQARADGLLFPTVKGQPMHKDTLGRHWSPIRSAFRETVTEERWAGLLQGQAERDLAFYSLRHHCASQIVSRGGNEYDVAAQLGNTPEVARATYIHDYRDRTQERLRGFLDRPVVVDLDAARAQREIG